jgi:DNA primase
MKHKKWTHWKKSHIAEIVKLRRQGLYNKEIAERVGASEESVALQFHKLKKETGKSIKRPTKAEVRRREKLKRAEQLSLLEPKPKKQPLPPTSSWKPVSENPPVQKTVLEGAVQPLNPVDLDRFRFEYENDRKIAEGSPRQEGSFENRMTLRLNKLGQAVLEIEDAIMEMQDSLNYIVESVKLIYAEQQKSKAPKKKEFYDILTGKTTEQP